MIATTTIAHRTIRAPIVFMTAASMGFEVNARLMEPWNNAAIRMLPLELFYNQVSKMAPVNRLRNQPAISPAPMAEYPGR